MEIIYPVGSDASNINVTSQKRLLRVVQGQTQATPTSGYLDPSLRNTSGGIRVPLETDEKAAVATGAAAASPFSRNNETKESTTGTAFTYEGSLTPGLCLVKTAGENYAIAAGSANENVFGLLGQWVGGTFDGVKNTSNISAWQGPDSIYDLLAPGFNSQKLSTEVSEKGKEGVPVYLTSGLDGRLCVVGGPTKNTQKVAEVIEYNPSVLRIRVLI
jgi:hypothetical protein